MTVRLKKIYYTVLTPAILGFFSVHLARNFHRKLYFLEEQWTVIAPVIFILAVVFAVAGPILYRTYFAHRQRYHSEIPLTVLFKFERNLIGMGLVAPYLALAVYFLRLPYFYFTGTLLMALYAIYYYYPSKKRIALDRRIFRARDLLSEDRIRRQHGNEVSRNGYLAR
jgi:hypothetical protein